MAHRLDRGRSTVDAITVKQALRVGISGSDVKGLFRYTPTLSPVAVGANTTAEQTLTVTGLAVGDIVIAVRKPTQQNGLGIVNARVSATNTLAVAFSNNSGSSITPTASEVYEVIVWRP